MNARLFVHCGLIEGRTDSIMQEFFDYLSNSDVSKTIDVEVHGVGSLHFSRPWLSTVCESFDRGEFYTLGKIKRFSDEQPTKVAVGYIHTKGLVNGFENPCISDWRQYMSYFVLERAKECISSVMSDCDVAGVDWHTSPNRHFSGNFWWSNTDYIKTLPSIDPPSFQIQGCPSFRHLAEFWIGANDPKVNCLHQSEIDVYQRHLHRYPSENYRKSS